MNGRIPDGQAFYWHCQVTICANNTTTELTGTKFKRNSTSLPVDVVASSAEPRLQVDDKNRPQRWRMDSHRLLLFIYFNNSYSNKIKKCPFSSSKCTIAQNPVGLIKTITCQLLNMMLNHFCLFKCIFVLYFVTLVHYLIKFLTF